MTAAIDSEIRLTDAELEVARLVGMGYTDQQITHALVMSIGAVCAHLRSAYAKTGTNTPAQLTHWLTDVTP
jgi:DNA-binding CsgD family transcriptional regulator